MNVKTFRVAAGVSAARSSDGLVILDVGGGQLLASNTIGARIWQLLEDRRTCRAIACQLVEDFDVPFDRAERDVAAFTSSLLERGLIEEMPT
jgi:hypothetical protein